MSSVLDFVLDGLERALELERELGVRSIECDRSLLVVERREVQSPPSKPPVPKHEAPSTGREAPSTRHEAPSTGRELVFLHDRPLSPGGVEMMAKIVGAMKRTAENTPIVVVPPVPKKAKIVVVLGARALRLYYPELKGEPGQWLKTPDGQDMLVTYSPEYILRFGNVTPAVQKLKKDMWRSLKAVVQRLNQR